MTDIDKLGDEVAALIEGAEEQTARPQPIAANPTQPASTAGENADHGFVTFDAGRKYLARIVAENGKKLIVRLFSKKTGEWQTKSESRERETCIPLTAAEAEESFPGCVAAWANTTAANLVGYGVTTSGAQEAATAAGCALIADLESYIRSYVTFSETCYALVIALWVVATFIWTAFDAFP
jgi:hypothetical protein